MMTVSACLWLGLFPLLQFGSYSTITYNKWTFMLVLACFSLFSMVNGRHTERIGHTGGKAFYTPVILAAAFTGWIILSCLISPYPSWTWLLGSSARMEGLLTQLCYIGLFFMFAFIGWAWEVIVALIQTGTFVNRGSLYGPWVPIYGAGGALILIVVCKLRTRPVLEFFSIMAVCGVVEYLTSYVMEKLYDMRWWDYSGYFLNLNGRICAEGLFAFAALGCMLVYFLGPQLDNMLMRANQKKLVAITVILLAFFSCDVVYSQIHPHTGTGITDMGQITPPQQVCWIDGILPQRQGQPVRT